MLVCSKCWNYYEKCTCSCKQKDLTKNIDDDIVDIVCELNKTFISLNWDIRTAFCCGGHITIDADRELPDYATPHCYVMFKGDPSYFHYIWSDSQKLTQEVESLGCKFRVDIDNELYNEYRCTLSISSDKNTDNLDLPEKISFLKGKVLFFEFLLKKILYLKSKEWLTG